MISEVGKQLVDQIQRTIEGKLTHAENFIDKGHVVFSSNVLKSLEEETINHIVYCQKENLKRAKLRPIPPTLLVWEAVK